MESLQTGFGSRYCRSAQDRGASCLTPTGYAHTTSLGSAEIVPGDAETIGPAHGFTLMSETVRARGAAC